MKGLIFGILRYTGTEVCGFNLDLKETPPAEDVFSVTICHVCNFSSIAEKYFRSEHSEQVKYIRFYISTQEKKFCIPSTIVPM